jgi:hypothetical protein
LGTIYHQLLRQASMMAFNDSFFLLSALMLVTLLLVLLMQRGKEGKPPMAAH